MRRMSKEKLMTNILQSFDGGISRADLILNTFHSDYNFNEHPEIEVNEAINVLISLGILKQHEHNIQGKIMGTSISLNLKETLKRLKALDKIYELSPVMVETGRFSTKNFDNFLEDIEKAEHCFKETKQ